MPAKKHKNARKKGTGKGKTSNSWDDHLTRLARARNYPARSVFKLEEIQKKFKVIRKTDRVLDLGCAPGSWLLYASQQAAGGSVVGIDLKPVEIKLPENARAVQDNILNMADDTMVSATGSFDVVLSDMAPATTGRKDVDAQRSFDLCQMALDTAQKVLKPKGHFVCKIFQGNEFSRFQKKVSQAFNEVKIFKPESCRKQSKEIYIIAKEKQ